MKKQFNIVISIAYALIITLLLLMGCSCGSKKRTVDKRERKTERKEVKEVSELIRFDVEKTKFEYRLQKLKRKTREFDFSGEVADDTKPAKIVIKEDDDGTTTIIFDNFKKVDGKTKKDDREAQTETETKEQETDQSVTDRNEKTETEEKEHLREKEVYREVKNKLPWWIWIVFSGFLIYLLWDVYKKIFGGK